MPPSTCESNAEGGVFAHLQLGEGRRRNAEQCSKTGSLLRRAPFDNFSGFLNYCKMKLLWDFSETR
jgi:hypothetical protein